MSKATRILRQALAGMYRQQIRGFTDNMVASAPSKRSNTPGGAIGGIIVGAMAIGGGSSSSSRSEEAPVVRHGNGKDYCMLRKIGKGTSSEVFEGFSPQIGGKCAIKVFRSVKEDRLQREVQILEKLRGGPNIIELFDVLQESGSQSPCLILEYVEKVSHKALYPTLCDREVRFYMYLLVQALVHCHDQGVMHRDVKPQNIVIDHQERKLRLVDFGLAEFYRPEQEYSVRVSSLYYKPPELLCGLRRYDCSLDVWSLGCLLAGLIFRKEPFFQGHDQHDQLVRIARVLGTDELLDYLQKYDLKLEDSVASGMRKFTKKPWTEFITEGNCHLVSEEAIDLVGRMLVYDHADRITTKDMLGHPYFDPVRQQDHLESVAFWFQPGALGIAALPNGLVTHVDICGQGGRLGVAKGWHIDGINQQRFSVQLLKKYATGHYPYSITFQKCKEI